MQKEEARLGRQQQQRTLETHLAPFASARHPRFNVIFAMSRSAQFARRHV